MLCWASINVIVYMFLLYWLSNEASLYGKEFNYMNTLMVIKVMTLGMICFWCWTACTLTFMRFFPSIKAKYDYGMMISILSFSFVSISGLRDDEIFLLLQKRVSTIFLGACVCLIISISISPFCAGQDLHNRIALNIEYLALFFEGIHIYITFIYITNYLHVRAQII